MSRFRRRPLIACVLALVFLQLVPVPLAFAAVDRWSERIDQIVNGENYRQAHWGLLVVDSQTGETVYSHNADRLFMPASVTKLFSVAAALGILGADYRFLTPVYRRGRLAGQRLE